VNKLKNKLVLGLMAVVMMAVAVPGMALAQANVDRDDVFGTDEIEGNIALGKSSLQATIVRLINVTLSLLGIIAVVIVLAGGFKWMTYLCWYYRYGDHPQCLGNCTVCTCKPRECYRN
jgi:hypothetical protein